MNASTSQAQIDANRQNAQLSSGPKTSEGKAKSALNSVKTGLTGRTVLIDLETFLTYEKQLRNLQIQEARLQRQRARDTAELQQLQQERIQKEKQQMEAAAELYLAAKRDNQPFDPAAFGFVFSTADIETHLKRVRAAHLAREERKLHAQAA